MLELSKKQKYPFLSVLIIICALFIIVFFKMEILRMNYVILKSSRAYGKLQDKYYNNLILYRQKTQHGKLSNYADNELSLKKTKKGQIIYFIGDQFIIQ